MLNHKLAYLLVVTYWCTACRAQHTIKVMLQLTNNDYPVMDHEIQQYLTLLLLCIYMLIIENFDFDGVTYEDSFTCEDGVTCDEAADEVETDHRSCKGG